jgi:hypothetical protein
MYHFKGSFFLIFIYQQEGINIIFKLACFRLCKDYIQIIFIVFIGNIKAYLSSSSALNPCFICVVLMFVPFVV